MTTNTRAAHRRLFARQKHRDFIQQHNPGALQISSNACSKPSSAAFWQEPGEYRETLENLFIDSEES